MTDASIGGIVIGEAKPSEGQGSKSCNQPGNEHVGLLLGEIYER
jgi:hypothetical protein